MPWAVLPSSQAMGGAVMIGELSMATHLEIGETAHVHTQESLILMVGAGIRVKIIIGESILVNPYRSSL